MAIEVLSRLTNKVGPLPAWAWAAIPATGYVAWSYYRASQGSSVISDDMPTGGAEGTEAEDYGINPGGVSLPGYGTTPSGSSNIPSVDTPKFDNQSWFKQASNFLIGEGVTSTDVVTALNAYLYGTPTTINQTQLNALQRALIKFGAAPDPAFVPGVSTLKPTPQPTPTVSLPGAPTTVQARLANPTTVTVMWGAPQTTGNAAIVGYKIEQWQQPSPGQWKMVHSKLALASARSVNFTVSKGVWNSFRVYARNSKGYGPMAYQSVKS